MGRQVESLGREAHYVQLVLPNRDTFRLGLGRLTAPE